MAGPDAARKKGDKGGGMSRKRKAKRPLSDEELRKAKQLEKSLFGAGEDLDDFGREEEDEPFSIADLIREEADAAAEREGGEGPSSSGKGAPKARKPAWVDDDEVVVDVSRKARLRKLREAEDEEVLEGGEFAERLREKHASMNPRTSWASLDKGRKRRGAGSDSDSDDGEEGGAQEGGEEGSAIDKLVQGAGKLVARSQLLPPGVIEATRLKDANLHDPSKAVVQSVEFHPNRQLLMTAGFDKALRVFQVDGKRNPKVQGVFLEDMPVHQAQFACGGAQVVAAGRRKHFYVWDLQAAKVERVNCVVGRTEKSLESFAVSPSSDRPMVAFLGNDGYVPLVSLKSKQWVGSLKMSGSVRAATFLPGGHEILTAGGDGVVYTWDVRTMRCVGRCRDDGSLGCTGLAASPRGDMYATGSGSGVVNLYKHNPGEPGVGAPSGQINRPIKSIMNLTTTIDSLCFSPDGQILATASRMKRDALRLVHVPTMTVFSNWPSSKTPIQYASAMAFSPGGGYFAVGNARGRVLLYRLHHYDTV